MIKRTNFLFREIIELTFLTMIVSLVVKVGRNMMRKIFALTLLAASIILAGCAPAEFVNPDPQKLTLGISTKEDVLQAIGKDPAPKEFDGTMVQNGLHVHFIVYTHIKSASFWGLIVPRHSHVYVTYNNILVGEDYDSSYDEDSTRFDPDKVAQIKNGMTKQDVIALMGKPSGRSIYPLAKKQGDTAIHYMYSHARFAGIATTTEIEDLTVSLDEKNVVDDVKFKQERKFGIM